ncbi:MAG: 30S ribosomal protein S7 [Aquificota bacterium]|jgi:small subunit ribosomal protein S7|nr:30S ribosomal protein S7 [Aquificaceae bacterium]MDM7266519.1 30S ribosomal protein S7 [Aquificaceae bacterium]QWK13105.1 MAG: 30S ribosomal protein S7 [Aquificota bacterium]HAV40369.1 30S ribosomal protein S7 [Aquificaceae bacterium]HCO39009.1 30S ribosomal protein S7 [Aquificaceae bacterium]
MPRKGPVPPREILPDPKYGDVIVHKLINKVMKDGKKSVAEWIVYTALESAAKEVNMHPVELLHKVVEKLKPEFEVRPRRVGGATYQVPVEVPPRRQISLALKWLVEAARERARHRGSYTMVERLKAEMLDVLQDKGGAIKRKEDTHKMAEANKVFAHFRW